MSVKTHTNNRPRIGSRTKVEPIRSATSIQKIRALLRDKPRDLCLFVLGINTAYRASELLSLTCKQVENIEVGSVLSIYQSKTGKYRSATINKSAASAIHSWLKVHPNPEPDAPLFVSRKGTKALTVSSVTRLVKRWCRSIGASGNYGSHSLRKTWGYHQLRNNHSTPAHMLLPILMVAFGHSTQEQTLAYLCIQSDEIANLFLEVEL